MYESFTLQQYFYVVNVNYTHIQLSSYINGMHSLFILCLIILGAAPITNGLATVTLNGLACGVTYTIIAGGTLNGQLVGPRSPLGNITTAPCALTSTQSGKKYPACILPIAI